MDESSKFVDNDFAGGQDAGDIIRNGRVGSALSVECVSTSLTICPLSELVQHCFCWFRDKLWCDCCWSRFAVVTAQQIDKTEAYRDTASFADIVRGMQLYGRKILRPEALFTACYNKLKTVWEGYRPLPSF